MALTLRCSVILLLFASGAGLRAEVAIWTASTSWISPEAAGAEAQITSDRLEALDIPVFWFADPAQDVELADWVDLATDNGELDVLILYGRFPPAIYPGGNAQPDGSLAELFIESTDGDTIINHADWMFYVSDPLNTQGGLENMMDLPGITMGGNDNPMTVTPEGRAIAPSLGDFLTDRPLHLDGLGGDWVVEVALAESADGLLADPVVVRDGDRGRLVPIFQTNQQADPKGAVAAEVIAWLNGTRFEATQLGFEGPPSTLNARPVALELSLLDEIGFAAAHDLDLTVSLQTDSPGGAFDLSADGSFDGSVTSVDLPAAQASTTIYYRDATAGTAGLAATAAGFTAAAFELEVLEDLSGTPGEVAIFTGRTGWVAKAAADVQAGICSAKLELLGVTHEVFADPLDDLALADWVVDRTDNGEVDVLMLYGFVPSSIYAAGNLEPDDSIAELFLESTDGDVILNHADYFFYVSDPVNNVQGLQNLMDLEGIVMWGDDTAVAVTEAGGRIAPSLGDFLSDRPFHVDALGGEWFVEAALAENAAGTRADPVIVRDGNRGRVIPALQAAFQDDPKGAVAAEIVAWLYGIDSGGPTQVALEGRAVGQVNDVVGLEVQIQDVAGSPSVPAGATVVNLATDSDGGAFDLSADGNFDGSVVSVTLEAGQSSVRIYYRDGSAGTPTLEATAAGLDAGTIQGAFFASSFAPPGEVVIWTGSTNWIPKAAADAEAQIAVDRLEGSGIPATWFAQASEDLALAELVEELTDNGELDVLILYGRFPGTLYAGGNAMPDGSIAELFIESGDGDVIINHADWMFYVSDPLNTGAGLENMMDVPGVSMAGNNDLPLTVTELGRAIAPSLADFATDRPLHLETLGGNWYAEAVLAANEDGTLADPVIVRDGDGGRLIPLYQTNQQNDPKGAVAAEIIAWLHGVSLEPTQLGIAGAATLTTATSVRFEIRLEDAAGIALASDSEVTVQLGSDSATGTFDTSWGGDFDGSVDSLTLPAGQSRRLVYYQDTEAGDVTLTVSAAGLAPAELPLAVVEDLSGAAGQVAMYTGSVGWIEKPLADAEAEICIAGLEAASIPSTWFSDAADDLALADWLIDATDNGEVDVLVLYGFLPSSIYAAGNLEPDDSLAEIFLESTDGDVILNHADYMFYVSNPINNVQGLENLMDVPGITMWGNDDPMEVTEEGATIAPSLVGFASDRPLHLDQLAGDWFVEAPLAESASGLLADPVIIRDGNRGRLIPVMQAAFQDDPKGEVAAEIITWLLGAESGGGVGPFRRGDCDGDGSINLTDGIFLLNFLFLGGADPRCNASCDNDGGGALNITDGIYILNFLFLGGPPPLPPTEDCARSSTPADVANGCETFAGC